MKFETLIKLLTALVLCVIIGLLAVLGTMLYHINKPIKNTVELIEQHSYDAYKEGYNQGVVDILRLDDTYKRIDIKRFEDLRTKRFADYRR